MAADPEFEKQIHLRLLNRDPVAPEELARLYLPLVQKRVRARARAHGVNDEDLVSDATADAVLGYIKNPSQFNPALASLLFFLTFSAERDLINLLRRHRRVREAEILSTDVELRADEGNRKEESAFVLPNPEKQIIARIDVGRRVASLNEKMSVQDRSLLQLLKTGERRTESFATILGITHMPIDKQRLEVKRHKDRLKKLVRTGSKREKTACGVSHE